MVEYLLKLTAQCKTSYVGYKVLYFGFEKSAHFSVVRETMNIFYCDGENLFSLTPTLTLLSSCNVSPEENV